MRIYAYISERSERSFIVTLLSADGYKLTAFECFSYKKAPEIAQKIAAKVAPGIDVEWLPSPWANDDFRRSQRMYKRNWDLEQLDWSANGPY